MICVLRAIGANPPTKALSGGPRYLLAPSRIEKCLEREHISIDLLPEDCPSIGETQPRDLWFRSFASMPLSTSLVQSLNPRERLDVPLPPQTLITSFDLAF